ncbi:MAG TPA: methyltransferase domain-containing protein [Desulfitobacteriaceae bacterium]|nr:methyltransferase domain-containing protein [Desulfitobacteriaceae bacterium]
MNFKPLRQTAAQIDFNVKSGIYEETSLVQKSAAQVLRRLLAVQPNEDILDLGCGPGNITGELALSTKGKVLGVDLAAGMIAEARRLNTGIPNLYFEIKDAADLGFVREFDVIMCNSAFQWFTDPVPVIEQCCQALRPGGRLGIQAPATNNYCQNFVAVEEKIRQDPATKAIYAGFVRPWLFLESASAYRQLFEERQFKVTYSELVREETGYTVDQAYKIYQSGAENGYLNQAYNKEKITESYVNAFRRLVKETLVEQTAEDGLVKLVFNRIYLVAEKP